MKKLAASLAFMAVALLILGSGIQGGEKKGKEVTLKGSLVCGKCTLEKTKKCCNVLEVKEGDKTVEYYLKDKGNKEKYHKGICPPGSRKDATVTGVVTEKGGKKWITPTEVKVK